MDNEKSAVIKAISSDRKRTNMLRNPEQALIAFLVPKIPRYISSDMLTTIGLMGNILVGLSMILGSIYDVKFLLLGLLGFMVSWFGDSMDGRVAYYREIPRKWYGTVLDVSTDWIGVALMGMGFMFYLDGAWQFLAFAFTVLYAWEMLTAMLRFKVTGKYAIDSGLFGPTEVRLVLMLILVMEVIFTGSLKYIAVVAVAGILISNVIEFFKLLKTADARDIAEKKK